MPPDERPRRGWRERVEPGLYRAHVIACPRSADRRRGGRCGCPLQLKAPGSAPGTSRTVTFRGSVADARNARRRLLAAGQLAEPLTAARAELDTVHAFAADWFRAGAQQLVPATTAARDKPTGCASRRT